MGALQELKRTARELEEVLAVHQETLSAALRERDESSSDGQDKVHCCSRTQKYRELIVEAIEVIEGTRKAFKSKKLEILRKRLVSALVELN